MVDRVYRAELPRLRKALEDLHTEFSALEPSIEWTRLRVEPLVALIERLQGAVARWDATGTRGAVPMLHADLVYLRVNVRVLRGILTSERKRAARGRSLPRRGVAGVPSRRRPGRPRADDLPRSP